MFYKLIADDKYFYVSSATLSRFSNDILKCVTGEIRSEWIMIANNEIYVDCRGEYLSMIVNFMRGYGISCEGAELNNFNLTCDRIGLKTQTELDGGGAVDDLGSIISDSSNAKLYDESTGDSDSIVSNSSDIELEKDKDKYEYDDYTELESKTDQRTDLGSIYSNMDPIKLMNIISTNAENILENKKENQKLYEKYNESDEQNKYKINLDSESDSIFMRSTKSVNENKSDYASFVQSLYS
jgi:hypothetical protein